MKQHEVVKAKIRRFIEQGRYPVAAALPRLDELAHEQGCSVSTVRRALRDLADAGVVQSAKRRGTIVLRRPALGRAVVLLASDLHTNLILQEPICTALMNHNLDVDILAAQVGTEALRSWCTRLTTDEQSSPTLVILGLHPQDSLETLNSFFKQQVWVTLDDAADTTSAGVSRVGSDWRREARVLAEFLLELKHQSVAIWAGYHPTAGGWHQLVAKQFADLWEVASGNCHLYYAGTGLESLIRLVKEDGVTAYVDLNDHTAMNTLSKLQERGIVVPDDLSVIGRHDTPWAEQTVPPLSSLSINPEGIAAAVVLAVSAFFKGQVEGQHLLVSPLMVARASTAICQEARR